MRVYKVTFYTYSGMSIPMGENISRDMAIEMVRKKNRWARERGQPVTKIGPGRWEHETPEDAFMISDYDGILVVKAKGHN
jgi:hypothetical protein